MKYYTKEIIKLMNIMAIGILIISVILLIKLKPVYQVSMGGEVIGYIRNKNQFEKIVYEKFNHNLEENIAFAEFSGEAKYDFKLVEKDIEIEEEQVLLALTEKADITYFQYAVYAGEKQEANFRTEGQAYEVMEQLEQDVEDEVDLYVKQIYTKELEVIENTEVAYSDIITKVKADIKEEKRREKATINGVYIAVVPVQGNITSRYGAREEIRDHTHKGLDIAAATGTSIKATADGTVTYSGTMGGYGNLIIIDHGNGITTYYGHCSKLYKKKGDTVTAGDVIAAVGSTGNSTGPHLHFEIRKNGVYVNPSKYLF